MARWQLHQGRGRFWEPGLAESLWRKHHTPFARVSVRPASATGRFPSRRRPVAGADHRRLFFAGRQPHGQFSRACHRNPRGFVKRL